MTLRLPAVAGMFYPARPAALEAQLGRLLRPRAPRPAHAVLLPHAGYDWSGPVAGAVLSRVAVPRDVVLLSFSHAGEGADFAIWPRGAWRTPLGDVPVAEDLAARLQEAIPVLEEDEGGFLREHSGEVQVPLLRALQPDLRLVPVAVNAWRGGSGGADEIRDFARLLASALGDELVVATTDLTHCGEGYGVEIPPGFSAARYARSQDESVLAPMEKLDVDGFLEARDQRDVTMCGVGPTIAFLEYGRARGAAAAERVSYATSADADPGDDRAVGYPGLVIWR